MTIEQVGMIIGITAAILGCLYNFVMMRERFAKIEVKVDTMWAFQLRRAEAEAVIKGVAAKNSPVEIKASALECIPPPMAEELRAFYGQFNKALPDKELMLEIERQFGERLVSEVCIPNGFTDGTCLLIAVAVAKTDPLIFVSR